jgi:hypothetical protein
VKPLNIVNRASNSFHWTMKYQGQILDGQMHGDGKLTYDNGEYYDGEWVKGKRGEFL